MKILLENWRKYLNEGSSWDLKFNAFIAMLLKDYPKSKTAEEDCDGAWSVRSVSADSGWGPMLYDIAIEWATQNANGLIADRAAVEDDAKNVWDYYLNKRDDVQVHQLGDDNCDQDVAIEDRGEDDWANSPLSKRYTKEPTTINALNDAGKLKVRRDLK